MSAAAGRDAGLAGKVALVTGGADGIGRALAVAYARASTVLGYLPGGPHDPRQAVAEAEAAGGRGPALACDVTDPASVDVFTDAAHDHFGGSTWWSPTPEPWTAPARPA